jgi:hypothetical protein
MIEGQSYRLNTGSKVTLLETPPDLRRRARARIRFETGIKRGEETEIACVRISEPWDGPAPRRVSTQTRALPEYTIDHREPRPGDMVRWTKTAELIWEVSEVDRAEGSASINGEVLAQHQDHTVPIEELTVVHRTAPTRSMLPAVILEASPAPTSAQGSRTERELAPERPRRRLEEILDALLFTTECLAEYRRRCSPHTPTRDIADTLRQEIRTAGYIADATDGKSLRLRVDRRFEIVQFDVPNANDTVRVTKLRYLGRRKPTSRGSG